VERRRLAGYEMAKKRIHEIAKAQGLTSKELLAGLKAAGVEAKSAQSSVEESVALAALNLTEARPKATAEDALPAPPNRKGGWYPDPEGSGRLRFWNKKRWTDDFMDAPGEATRAGAAGAKASGSGTRTEQPKQRGRWGGAPWWAWVLAGFVGLVIISAIAGGDESSNDSGSNDTATQAAQTHSTSKNTATQAPAPQAAPPPQEPDLTAGQENALNSAQDYIDLSGFSRAGLIRQLSSSAGEGFSKADATFAANHVGADWNAEAVEAAQEYLDFQSFSRSGLIEQLSSSAGDQFTPAQAQYAVDQVYGH
jgi:hypothetical protein